MIQRIQSVYLFLTIVLSILFLTGSFFAFTDSKGMEIEASMKGVSVAAENQTYSLAHNTLPVTVLVLLTSLISMATIFSFKNRRIQKKLAVSVIILAFMLIITSVYCIWFVTTEYQARFTVGYKIVIPVLMLVFSILASRGIKKDDNLVKSYDRLR